MRDNFIIYAIQNDNETLVVNNNTHLYRWKINNKEFDKFLLTGNTDFIKIKFERDFLEHTLKELLDFNVKTEYTNEKDLLSLPIREKNDKWKLKGA